MRIGCASRAAFTLGGPQLSQPPQPEDTGCPGRKRARSAAGISVQAA